MIPCPHPPPLPLNSGQRVDGVGHLSLMFGSFFTYGLSVDPYYSYTCQRPALLSGPGYRGHLHRDGVRPPLKKMLFPVQRPGDFITAEWEFFFPFCPFFFVGQDFIIFLQKKYKKKQKKKGFAAARLATISATRYTGNKTFF